MNKKKTTHKKEPSCEYDEVLDMLKMGPTYYMGKLTNITFDDNKTVNNSDYKTESEDSEPYTGL